MQRLGSDAPPFSHGSATAPLPRATGPAADSGSVETLVEAVWRIIRRHVVLILASTFITAAVAYLYSSSKPKQYTATAAVLFRSASDGLLSSGQGYVDPNRQAATNEGLLVLPVVAQRAARLMGGDRDPAAISAAVSVASSRDSDIVDINATTTDPAEAARIANAYGRAFRLFRQESARAEIDSAIALARSAEASLPVAERQGQRGQELRERITQLETAKDLQTGGAEVVQQAAAPSWPSAPTPRRDGILGAILGGLLGFTLAALRERWDRTVKSIEELEQIYNRPILARVPRSRALTGRREVSSRGEEAEVFRGLRSSLRYFNSDGSLRSLMVTSPLPGEGKSTVARQLAITMAAMGDQVVLVEADLHGRGAAQRPPGQPEPRGLSEVLIGESLAEALTAVAVPGDDGEAPRRLAVLTAGPVPPNPSELLEGERMREVLRDLEMDYDIVILDTPPLGVLSDALPLAALVSGIVVVGGISTTTRDAARDLTRQLALVDGPFLGVVANFMPVSNRAAGAYFAPR
jgi:capsular exopolysaccharide synthesis family protein